MARGSSQDEPVASIDAARSPLWPRRRRRRGATASLLLLLALLLHAASSAPLPASATAPRRSAAQWLADWEVPRYSALSSKLLSSYFTNEQLTAYLDEYAHKCSRIARKLS